MIEAISGNRSLKLTDAEENLKKGIVVVTLNDNEEQKKEKK